jgi:ABC-type nitrate/sulfonate/bicarbonate transport system substrate-binding protein
MRPDKNEASRVRRKRITLVSALLVLLAAAAAMALLKGHTQKADSLEAARIGAARGFAGGLVYVADEKGFFRSRGVNVTIKEFETRPMAVDALVDDKVDVTTAAEFVMVRRSFDNDHLRTYAQIANMNPIEIIARRGPGIEKISDLKGKKIGLTLGSSSEFYLDRFLKLGNISNSGAKIASIGPNAMEDSLYNGSVDAVVGWGLSPATTEKIARALIDAEQFAAKHPDEARRIIETNVRPSPANVPPDGSKFRLTVRLDQTLLTLMEAEAAWMIRNPQGIVPLAAEEDNPAVNVTRGPVGIGNIVGFQVVVPSLAFKPQRAAGIQGVEIDEIIAVSAQEPNVSPLSP